MKKKILIIGLTEKMGGVETFIYNTTRFSDISKYEYDYLVHGTNNCVFQNDIDGFYNNGIHIYFVRKYKRNPLRCMLDLIKFYRRNGLKYDYVHIQTGATSEILYVFPYCLFYKFKIISHSHNGNGYNPKINAIFRPIVNLISEKRLACSSVAGEWLFGKKGYTAQIVNNGIDTNYFSFSKEKRKVVRERFGIKEEMVIGHIGRFSEQKNHSFLLEIFVEILKRSSSKLMLVGEGELQEDIQNEVSKLGIDKSVIFCGKQMDTSAFYSAFDVFLMPSLYEGLPIVGIEAQSEGLPCYFSNSISEQIKITDNAHIINLKEKAETWADIIMNNMDEINRNQYSQIVNDAGYSIYSTVKVLEDVYEV